MLRKEIIQRIEEPTAYYTIENLKRLAKDNNIEVRRGITKTELINRLTEANIFSPPKSVEVSNIGVLGSVDPLALITSFKRKTPTSAYEDLYNYRKYIQNIKREYLTPRKLKQIQKTLEKKEKKAEEERNRLLTPVVSESALRKFARVYTIKGIGGYDGVTFLNEGRDSITKILRENKGTKVKLVFNYIMEKEVLGVGKVRKPFASHSTIELNLEETDENELYTKMIDRIEEKMQKLESAEGTGWYFVEIINLQLHTVKYTPLRGSSYMKLPKFLESKGAIINMKNDDDKCFLWCVLKALNLKDNHNEIIDGDLKSKIDTLDIGDIKYPVKLPDINEFERLNSSIAISVFAYSTEDKVYPLRISGYSNRLYKIKLFLITEEEKRHYCLIKNMSRLVSSQVSKCHGTIFKCERCMNHFLTEKSLKAHEEHCNTNECIKINMPEKGSSIFFKDIWKSQRVPFIIYADTESLLKPIQSCESDPDRKYTNKYQKHEPISFSYYIKCFDDNVCDQKPRTFTGENAMKEFVEWLEEDVAYIATLPSVGMIFEEEESKRFDKETICWICGGGLRTDKVKDHCHYTGEYRGAAHNKCNLKYKKPNFTPVVFHNLSNYDAHLFIKNLGYDNGNINCIPNNEEKYISFTKTITVGTYKNKEGKTVNKTHNIRFIDSFKFMSDSLDSLVNNLPEEAFNNIKKYYTGDELNLIKRKGVYPYEYMDSIERFKENKLPLKE